MKRKEILPKEGVLAWFSEFQLILLGHSKKCPLQSQGLPWLVPSPGGRKGNKYREIQVQRENTKFLN